MTMRENAAKVAEGLRKAIWERIEKRIDEQPIDGISAGNEFSEVIRAEQRGIVVGLRGARLSAISTVANFDFFPNPTRAKLEECVRAMEPLAKQADFYKDTVPDFEHIKVPLQFFRDVRKALATEQALARLRTQLAIRDKALREADGLLQDYLGFEIHSHAIGGWDGSSEYKLTSAGEKEVRPLQRAIKNIAQALSPTDAKSNADPA